MINIKNIELPTECWSCELTYDNTSGMNICCLTGEALYPMGSSDTRPDSCPLMELDWNKCFRIKV